MSRTWLGGLIHAYRLEPITDAAKELGKINPLAAGMSDEEKKEAAKKAEEDRRENIRIRQDYDSALGLQFDGAGPGCTRSYGAEPR